MRSCLCTTEPLKEHSLEPINFANLIDWFFNLPNLPENASGYLFFNDYHNLKSAIHWYILPIINFLLSTALTSLRQFLLLKFSNDFWTNSTFLIVFVCFETFCRIFRFFGRTRWRLRRSTQFVTKQRRQIKTVTPLPALETMATPGTNSLKLFCLIFETP